MIIAIDGPAGAGKGTIAKLLAQHFNLAHLDSGALYRAVAAKLLRQGVAPADGAAAEAAAKGLTLDDTTAADLRTEQTGEAASIVAAQPPVRAALLQFQRDFARKPPAGLAGAVIDGRDIGTVVCPEPDVIKLWVHASAEIRAERRFKELQERGDSTTYPRVLQDIKARDERDSSRAVAPLKPAVDAYDLDTTGLSIDQAFEKARSYIASRNRR